MKKLVICLLTLLLLVPLAPLAASADFIPNTTQVLPYIVNKAGGGQYGNWMDNIPSGDSLFKIYGYSVGYSNKDVTLNIYTNMTPGGDASITNCPVGDLALNLNSTGFTQALVLPTSISVSGGTLYNVTQWSTSQDLWAGRTDNTWIYGGQYRTLPNTTSSGAADVQVLTGTVQSSTISALWSSNIALPEDGTYELSILFPNMDEGADIKFLWASGTCANGVIFGEYTVPRSSGGVPVPPSALLLGSGLLGLVIYRQRRAASKS